MGRSVETIRYTLKQFDQEHPDLAIFPNNTGPLREEDKKKIYQQYRRGVSVDALAKRYCRTKTSIYRVINEMRAQRIMELPLGLHPQSDVFPRQRRKRRFWPRCRRTTRRPRRRGCPAGLPPYLASLYEVPLLTREQEAHLFRKFNYLKYKATKLRAELDADRAQEQPDGRDRIALRSGRGDRRTRSCGPTCGWWFRSPSGTSGQGDNFFELVSDGNMSLIRAVEKFDFARGNKFSTYASWAIMKNFARTIPDEHRHRDRFRTSHSEMFYSTEEHRTDQYEQESAQSQRERQIGKILERLDEREQKIIISRFGLDHGHEPLTLKEVGAEMGVTKERIRQIEARALNKLRIAAREEKIEVPEPA